MGPMLPYRDLRRGDIVVFLSPAEQGLFVVKRIIGIPGDRIHLRDNVVYRNGEKLDEAAYVQHKRDPNDPYYEERRPYRENFPDVAPSSVDNLPKNGRPASVRISRGRILSFRRTVTSPWATTAT